MRIDLALAIVLLPTLALAQDRLVAQITPGTTVVRVPPDGLPPDDVPIPNFVREQCVGKTILIERGNWICK